MNSVLTALEHRELKMSASHFGIAVIRTIEKGEFGIGIHKFLLFPQPCRCKIKSRTNCNLSLCSLLNQLRLSVCFRCLRCLQQVKHECSLVKNKLESLFRVSSTLSLNPIFSEELLGFERMDVELVTQGLHVTCGIHVN